MDSHSWEGQMEAERRSLSIVVYGYVIVWLSGAMQPSTFATNRRRCWDNFCRPEKRSAWKKAGARCVPARVVAQYPES